MIAEMDQDADVVLEDDKEEDKSEPAEVQEVVDVVTTTKIITEVVTAASETITDASTTITAAEAQVPAATLTVAPSRVTAAPNEQYARELEAELNRMIDWDEVIDHVKMKAKEDPAVKRYQALKRKPQTEAQARKNIMIYLKNVASFKMDYFKGMSYDDIRPIFERYFDSNMDFLQKTKEQIEEEESKALKNINETPAERAAKKQKLDKEVEELKRHLQIVPNEDDDVYTEATPLPRKLILLVERKYPLIRFTLDQMLNAISLEVEEESEVSLELSSFRVDDANEFKEKHAKYLMLLVKDLVLSSQVDAVD
nr:hypothetical protein [Tanacetum cinerariifolium]